MTRCKACPYGIESTMCEDCEHRSEPVCQTTLLLDAVRAYATQKTADNKAALQRVLDSFPAKQASVLAAIDDHAFCERAASWVI